MPMIDSQILLARSLLANSSSVAIPTVLAQAPPEDDPAPYGEAPASEAKAAADPEAAQIETDDPAIPYWVEAPAQMIPSFIALLVVFIILVQRFSISILIAMLLSVVHLLSTFISVILFLMVIYGENEAAQAQDALNATINGLDLFRGITMAGMFILIAIHVLFSLQPIGTDKSPKSA
jgi:hypothetical protein